MTATKEERLISSILTDPKKVGKIPVEQITHRVARFMIEASAEPETYARIPDELKDEAFYIAYLSNQRSSNTEQRLLTVPDSFQTEAVFMAAVKCHGCALQHVPVQAMSTGLLLTAVHDQGSALEFVPNALRTIEVYTAALSGYYGYQAWHMIPGDIQATDDFQLMAIDAAQRTGDLAEFVREHLVDSSNTDHKIIAIQRSEDMLGLFPDLEQFELMRLYIQRNDYPHHWFEDIELPDEPAEILKLAGNEKNKVRQVAMLQSIEGATLETLAPLAKASRSAKQKDLLRRLFGSRGVLTLLSADDKARARWFSEDLNL
ncbi:hypothetical protein [Pseudomonas serbica]|uniref:hypothetical protein n=1 Tax=Pseudomonas serbica TaxID=2965074 RepID=UPI00237C31A3|nr:hypothetical protein [Pseudomonas serbica]